MKAEIIRRKLEKHHHKKSDTILLEVLEGKPRSPKGGSWLEVEVGTLEQITEDPNFDREKAGYGKYLDKWFAEGLVTEKERDTGKE